jgi:hypothetical protein
MTLATPATPETDLYVVPQDLLLRPTPSGALQVHPASESAAVVPRELLPLLLLFARPRTLDAAFAQAMVDWEMERDEFERLVRGWVGSGLLSRADRLGDGRVSSRLSIFQKALAEHRADPERSFPLRSPFALQRPLFFYPGLGTRELHDAGAFPWVAILEAAYAPIKEELLALLARPSFARVNRNYTSTGEWAAAYLWVFGEEVEGVVAQCPETARALRQVPGVTSFGTTLFSALAPGTFLAPHYGYTNAKLRCQLPLIVPEACRLKLGDVEIEQTEGKCLIFDDSFLHSAWNESDAVRYVLIFDFFHPDLTAEEIEYLKVLSTEQKLGAPYLKQLATSDRAAWARREP